MTHDFIAHVPSFLAQAFDPASVPVPRDIDLPLPIPEFWLKILIVPTFLIHIFFVNLMLGGTLIAFVTEVIGLRFPRYDRLSHCIVETVTVNKSLAVVFGVAPLLMINLLYTVHFYSANALTGHVWVLIIPLIIVAFLLAYWHKYSWDNMQGKQKPKHLMIAGATSLLFLFLPLIFLVQINTMLYPEKWSQIAGFFAALEVGNVFPRYFHFVSASLAIMGLFLSWWFGRASFPIEEKLPGFTRAELRRHFYRWAFWVSCAQFIFGPLVFITLPTRGVTWSMSSWIIAGVLLAIVALWLIWKEIQESDEKIGQRFWTIVALFTLVILGMGQGRHLYRDVQLAPHKELIVKKTEEFRQIELDYKNHPAVAAPVANNGKLLFTQTCAACHALDKPTIAPTLVEIYGLYKGNPAGIVTWAKAPGKKRPQYIQMPPMAALGDEALNQIALYILEQGQAASPSPAR
jgi:cytochrome c